MTDKTEPKVPGLVEREVMSYEGVVPAPLEGAVRVSEVPITGDEGTDLHNIQNEIMEGKDMKSEIYERTELKPENIVFTDFGTLSGASGEVWSQEENAISLRKRLESGELAQEDVDRAFSFSNLKKYFVNAYRSARTRCVDGRCIVGYEGNREEMKNRELGPQNAGASVGAVVSRRIAEGSENDNPDTTSLDNDFESFSEMLGLLGLVLGGHSDSHANIAEGKTGCGAIDRMIEIVEAMADPKKAARFKELAKAVLGDFYDSEMYSQVLGNAVLLSSNSSKYFGDYKKTIFGRMKKRAKDAVSILQGDHHEVGVLVNRIHGFTFHRDEFSADSNHDLQAFNYDFWRTVELAEKIVSKSSKYKDMDPAEKDRFAKKFITTRVLYTLGTLDVLTDGSLKLIVVDEKTDDSENGEVGTIINLAKNFGTRTDSTPEEILTKAA